MTFYQLLEALRHRYPIVVFTVFVALAAGYALTLLLPVQYTAEAALVVDVTEAIDENDRYVRAEPSQGYIATQLDIIRSVAVSSRVVDRLKLQDDSYFSQLDSDENVEVPLRQRIRETLRRSMSATPSRDSQVVIISFTSKDPEFSARIANGFADAYLELVLEMSVEPARRQAAWFDEQRGDIRQWVEEARNSLSGFQQEQGLLTADERLDIETSRLQELSNQVVVAQTAASRAVSLSDELEQQVQRGGTSASLPQSIASPIYSELEGTLSAHEATIANLSRSLGKNHPRLIRARAERRDTLARLEKEVDVIRVTLKRDAELANARYAALTEELERQRERVLEVNLVRDQIPTLQREVENAEEAYRMALEQFSVNTLQSRLQDVSATVLSYAEPPLRPSSPDLRKNVIVAGFLGCLVGLLFVLFVEGMNPRVRGPRMLQELEVPYLGLLSYPDNAKSGSTS